MTRDEFILAYAEHLQLKPEDIRKKLGLFAIPCDCGEEDCYGWRMVHVMSLTIKEIVTMPEILAEFENDA